MKDSCEGVSLTGHVHSHIVADVNKQMISSAK